MNKPTIAECKAIAVTTKAVPWRYGLGVLWLRALSGEA
jgi:hypothetical protein